jgi:hypothetical protein
MSAFLNKPERLYAAVFFLKGQVWTGEVLNVVCWGVEPIMKRILTTV